MSKPVLFLDIDGVLNSRWWATQSKHSHGTDAAALDPACCALLRGVLDATGAGVVLSSSWRHVVTLDGMAGLLAQRGCPGVRFIGATPEWVSRGETIVRGFESRGHEIRAWLSEHPECERFAIVDDDREARHASRRFVRTDPEVGLTPRDCARLVALLNALGRPTSVRPRPGRQEESMETLSELIGQAHAAKARVIARMEQTSTSIVTYRDGVMEWEGDADLAALEQAMHEAVGRATERFHRLMMETHPAALHSYPEGPAVIEAMRAATASRSSGGE